MEIKRLGIEDELPSLYSERNLRLNQHKKKKKKKKKKNEDKKKKVKSEKINN